MAENTTQSDPTRFDKPYNPREVEDRWYRYWIDRGYFAADENSTNPRRFSIVIPPPNITGSLHLGHALNNTLQDLPLWFNEGLADYYATFEVTPNGKQASLGKLQPHHVLRLREQWLPPTCTVETPDAACAFPLVREPRSVAGLEYALTNSFGFGGANASIILRRWS